MILSLSVIESLMPHGVCWRWNPYLVLLHATADTLILFAYLLIPAIVYYIYRQGHLANLKAAYPKLWTLGALFVLLCGVSHLGAVVEIWVGGIVYWITGVEKILTGVVSLLFARRLWVLRDELVAIGRVMEEIKRSQREDG